MTDNEKTLKALEVCLCNSSILSDCACFCPAFNHEKFSCGYKHGTRGLYEEVADIINRQKAEIERLQKETECFADIGKMYSEIKSEAIKEFAERLKATYPPREDKKCTLDDCYTLDVIDNLVNEMTEGGESNGKNNEN